ncbi:MAG: hypothetical protein VKO64_07065 [Candidatus Sericytochromatia bacterium]|nr:hypothetical protein [Candidatus Sericytochromatia bacterium]
MNIQGLASSISRSFGIGKPAAAPASSGPDAVAQSARDRLHLSPGARAQNPVRVQRLKEWEDLAQLVTVLVGTPVTAAIGSVIGGLIGGPPGAAVGAVIGGSLPGVGFGAYDIIQNVVDRVRGDVPDWRQAKLGAKLMLLGPGPVLLGAAIGTAVGGPLGTAIGAFLGGGAYVGAILVGNLFGRFFRPSPPPVETPGEPLPVPPPDKVEPKPEPLPEPPAPAP